MLIVCEKCGAASAPSASRNVAACYRKVWNETAVIVWNEADYF